MARSKSSSRWLEEHVNDLYVKKAQIDGYRARAAYKLLELNDKDKLIFSGMRVLDLGSAPGSWSQVAGCLVGSKGRVIASDLLPMDSVENVDFIQGDFTEDVIFEKILQQLSGHPVDVVISDMAPNISGVDVSDQMASIYLVELALDMAKKVLKTKGDFLVKVFQGEGFDDYVKSVRSCFEKVIIRKPQASRPRSREVYLVAKNFNALF